MLDWGGGGGEKEEEEEGWYCTEKIAASYSCESKGNRLQKAYKLTCI